MGRLITTHRVAVRSKASAGISVVDAMYDTIIQTPRRI